MATKHLSKPRWSALAAILTALAIGSVPVATSIITLTGAAQ